jgi:hypothetical protein
MTPETYMTDDSREQCADPHFAIGYAKDALASAIRATETGDKEWALVNMRTALGALNENSEARERKFSPPF